MNDMIELMPSECVTTAGGKSEFIADIVEAVFKGLGAFAKLLYLANKHRQAGLTRQMAMGDQTLWK